MLCKVPNLQILLGGEIASTPRVVQSAAKNVSTCGAFLQRNVKERILNSGRGAQKTVLLNLT